MSAAIMFSGGLDSTTILGDLLDNGEDVWLLAFDDDSTNFKTRRIVALEQVAQHYGMYDRLKIIRTYRSEELRGQDTFGFIPGYKMAMQVACMAYAQKLGCTELYMGYNRENNEYAYTFKDELHENLLAVAELYNRIYDAKIEIMTPYMAMSKADIIRLGYCIDVPFEKTISCRATKYGGLIHCGTCLPCKSRINGFNAFGLRDPTDYWDRDGDMEKVIYGAEGTVVLPEAKASPLDEPRRTRTFKNMEDALKNGAVAGDLIKSDDGKTSMLLMAAPSTMDVTSQLKTEDDDSCFETCGPVG